MVDIARAAAGTSTRRDEILEAVAFAAERLLLVADWRDAADEVLAHLGVAADVSRAYLIENSIDPGGRLLLTQAAEWCAPGISSQMANPALRGSPWVEIGFARWVDVLGGGEIVVGDVAELPDPERSVLEAQDIRTLLAVPIHVDGDWWGCVGVDECLHERDWASGEIDALRTAAALVGAALTRRRQDERLRLAETRYRNVVERIPAVTYTDEPPAEPGGSSRLTFVSPQIEQIVGYPASRFVDEPGFWFTLMHPDDLAALDASGALEADNDAPYEAEYRMRHADGRWVWVHDSTSTVTDDTGAIAYFQGFMTDVTARKGAEARVDANEVRYRRFLESIPAVTYTDIPGDDAVVMGYVSPQIQRILGRPAKDFIEDERLWGRLIHPEDHARMRAAGAFDPTDPAPFDQEYRMQRADGSWAWVHDTSTAVFDADGSIGYFQGFMIDITARKVAEDRAHAADERFRALVEQLPAIVYAQTVVPGTSHADRMEYISPAAVRVLGYPLEPWLDDPGFWATIVHPDDVVRVTTLAGYVNETGEPFQLDYRVIAADGRTVWLHEEAMLALDGDGTPQRWHGLITDVTERTLAEAQIRAAEERFRLIVEETPAITYQELPASVYDPDSSVAYVSPQVETILGYSAEEWSTPGFWTRAVHPEDLDAVTELSAATNDSGEPYVQDYRMIAADGRVVWLHDECRAVRDAEGQITIWQGVITDITDRKEAEDQLRHAQDRLQALIDHIPATVYVEALGGDPSRFYISPQVERMFGYTPDEWTWTPDFWADHVHPDDRERAIEADRESDETRGGYSLDYRFLHADGSWVWVHDEAVFLPSSDGEGFWQGFLYDISSMKEAEERLLGAERLYRATVEQLPAVVYREPEDSQTHPDEWYISPRVRDLLGYTPEELGAQRPGFWPGHLHPEDRERAVAANEEANATKEPFVADYRLRRRDGAYVWVHDEATFVRGDGDQGWWQGFLLDITERVDAEQHIREAEEKFRTIVEQNPAVIYTQEFDPDGAMSRTTYISPRHPEIFGYTSEEVMRDPTLWARTVHPEDREAVLSADAESNAEQADSFSMEYRMIAKDGRIVWVQDQAVLVRVDGRAPFWQGFLLDITERKHAEEQLERALAVERDATRTLRALDEMKNTFLQAVSHDLRTPLAAILGLAITLERGDVQLEEADARDLAHRIATNARRLDRLVMNLLDLDRLARGIVTPKLAHIDVGALVRRVVSESELVSDSRLRIDVRAHVQQIDAAKVERIVENLLANAVRHAPATATIWVSLAPSEGGLTLAVEDEGPGVDPELREALFDPFRQGPDAPQHAPGVGVGLTLVRRFAELHGGRAWVQEREGGGASFRVFLPEDPPPVPGEPADRT